MKKIDFIVIGVQKAGTTALDHYLRQHPDIEMAKKKEVHFFDKEKFFQNNEADYSFYHSKFKLNKKNKIFGEITPIYSFWIPSCRRIWEYRHDIKIICILRNPIDRAFSNWNMEIDRDKESNTFGYAIRNESERIKEALPLQHRIYSYVNRGYYSQQIKRYKQLFSDDQLLYLKYEDFKSNQEYCLNNIFNFLNISSSSFIFEEKIIHNRPYRNSMSKEDRTYLKTIFQDDINEVEKLLNWNCEDWV